MELPGQSHVRLLQRPNLNSGALLSNLALNRRFAAFRWADKHGQFLHDLC